MNRTLPFGMHNIGYGYTIKINVKLTKKDAADIALSMVIRMAGESGHRTEGEIFRHVMDHLTNEFVNPDSFKDLEIKR
jgi:hypothetical protein